MEKNRTCVITNLFILVIAESICSHLHIVSSSVYIPSKSYTVKFLNCWTPEIFAVIYLRFKQRSKTLGYFVKMMLIEKQSVKTMIRLQSDLGLNWNAISKDHDQTAVWSGSALFAQTFLSQNLGLLRYFRTSKYYCNHPKIQANWPYILALSQKDADIKVNSSDPDKTAPFGTVWSGSPLFARGLSVQKLGKKTLP